MVEVNVRETQGNGSLGLRKGCDEKIGAEGDSCCYGFLCKLLLVEAYKMRIGG